jgi:hypothetical protein
MSAAKIIARIAGCDVTWDEECLSYIAGMQVDADGSPEAYHAINPHGGLDDWSSAGYPNGSFQDILVCDHMGKPMVQDGESLDQPAKGFFISMTSLQRPAYSKFDVRRYVDASTVPYAVIPSSLKKMVPPKFLGCRVEIDVLKGPMAGRSFTAVCGDVGSAKKLGEGSIALAHLCGFPKASPRNGIDDKVFRWRFMPGVPANISGELFTLQ